jgi:uncharacterized protein (TIGR02328 family)
MRLWAKQLIEVLPQKQIVSQWRELSAIVGSIEKYGTPNHLLVNKVMDYPKSHLLSYSYMVYGELCKRGYKPKQSVCDKIESYCGKCDVIPMNELFADWHNTRYLNQCLMNLQEKFDNNGITKQEWKAIVNKFC